MRYFGNSLFVAGVSVVISVVMISMSAYVVARMEFKGKALVNVLLYSTMFIPATALTYPVYNLVNRLHLYDTRSALILIYSCSGIAVSFFVIKNYYDNIPRELEEAAKIDGCNSIKTLWYVIVPMLKPSIVSCALFQFMWSSNDFMGPLLYVNTPARYPASIFVKMSMDGDTGFDWNRVLAMSLISIIPSLIVFFLAQDSFIDGIAAGGVKG